MLRDFAWIVLSLAFAQPRVAVAVEQGAPEISFVDKQSPPASVARGTKVEHVFGFRNSGGGPLRINGVFAQCGCATVDFDPAKTYLPGESGSLKVILDTSDFVGSVSKIVAIETNEPRSESHSLRIQANVFERYTFYPPLLDFKAVPYGTAPSMRVEFKSLGQEKLQILGSRSQSGHLIITTSQADGRWTVEVTLPNTITYGFYKDEVYIKTNDPFLPEAKILVRADVSGALTAVPSYLDFGAVAKGEAATREIALEGAEGFEILGTSAIVHLDGTKVNSEGVGFSIRDGKGSNQRTRRLHVRLTNKEERSGSVHGKLILKTNDPLQDQLAVDFYAYFR